MGKVIDWDVFTHNSSSQDSVYDFAEGASHAEALKGMWDKAAKREFNKLKKLPVKTARQRARRWCKKEGYAPPSKRKPKRSRAKSKVTSKKSVKINWDAFMAGSSIQDSIYDFAEGASGKKMLEFMYTPESEREFKKLISLPVSVARERAKRWCKKEGYYDY